MGMMVAIGAICAVLLTGCARRTGHNLPAAPPVPSTTAGTSGTGTSGTGGTGTTTTNVDSQIASTDGLLRQLDDQVDSDAQPARDAD
jgi:hypothetical protein